MFLAKTLSFYKRKDIQEEIVKQAKDKEIAFRFEHGFGKRPEALSYPNDVLELAKQKMTSLHCSEELWINPLQITTGMKKRELDEIRKGWDLILDIDCKILPYSKLAAYYTIKKLRQDGVKSITIKFSGNKGFHIAVPFQAFPEVYAGKKVKDLFPEAPRKIASYITHGIKEALSRSIMKLESKFGGDVFSKIAKRTGFEDKKQDIIRYEKNEFDDEIPVLNAEPFLEIDTLLISSRHLYRMPYSFHEKSQLVSLPIDPDKVLSFKKPMAEPDIVELNHPFLDRNVKEKDAADLLKNAYEFDQLSKKFTDTDKEIYEKEFEKSDDVDIPEEAIGEEAFPPCIKLLLNGGLEDGKKRALFALINFLSSAGWDYDMIEKRLVEWNKTNTDPLRDTYLLGQIRYARVKNKPVLPPNCNNPNYYLGLGVCKKDSLCQKIKNPATYAKIKNKMLKKKTKKKKKTSKKNKKEEKDSK
jgi:DNA primase catalytic subunit